MSLTFYVISFVAGFLTGLLVGHETGRVRTLRRMLDHIDKINDKE